MYHYYFDWTFYLLIPPFIFALWAQWKTRVTFQKFASVRTSRNITGAEVARGILSGYGVSNVAVESIPGELTDHYDPIHKALRLSKVVYESSTISALGVAAHEAGHAIQHAKGYNPIKVRSAIMPIVSVTSYMAIPLFFIGLLMSMPILIRLGIFLFSGVVAFHFVTLPVEFNASKRALAFLQNGSYLTPEELKGAKKVLDAAAMTYVAAALMALMNLLRLILVSRSRD